MARIEDRIRFEIQLGDEKNPVLILKRPTAQAIKAFLKSRFERRGNKIDDKSVEAREKFVDDHLDECENVEIKDGDTWVPLSPGINAWRDKIPLNWKTSIAVRFEEQETISGDLVKN